MACLTMTDVEETVSSNIHQNGGIVGNSTISRQAEQLFRIYLYNSPGKTEGNYLQFPAGEYVAEEICAAACKACGTRGGSQGKNIRNALLDQILGSSGPAVYSHIHRPATRGKTTSTDRSSQLCTPSLSNLPLETSDYLQLHRHQS